MKLLRFVDNNGETHLGQAVDGRNARVLEGDLFGDLRPTSTLRPIDRLLAPCDPVNIFCIGLNYRDHAAETGAALPEHPVIFMKPTTTVIAPETPIRLPAACDRGPEVDYEAELAVLIGRSARNVPASSALDHVFGYTCANDISARRWQKHGGGGQWIRGKSFDSFCPLGPVLVTADEIPDPQSLEIHCRLNGTPMQAGKTGDMIFSVAELVAHLSRDTTLLPGTLILTGTPAGVGFTRRPPIFLADGDEVTVEITGIGQLSNPVAAAS